MIFAIIMLPCYVIILASIMYNDKTATRPQGFILLGVTLPKVEMQQNEVINMVKKFKKNYKTLSLIFAILIVPTFFISAYPTTSCMYMYLWCGLYLGINQHLITIAFDELYDFKQKQGWVIGEQHTVSVDTEVSRLKNKIVYSKWFFLPCVLVTLLAAYVWIPPKELSNAYYTIPLSILFLLISCIILYFCMCRINTTVYSENSEINLALNKAFRYEMTKASVLLGLFNSITWLICGLFVSEESYIILIITASIISSILDVIILITAYQKVRKQRQLIDLANNSPIVSDDDIYWRGGIYRNPNDTKCMVEKRIGLGTTINMASKCGKILNFFVIIIIIVCIVMTAYFWPMDFPSLNVTMNDTSIVVDAGSYDYEVSLSDIKAISLLDEMPRADKNSGMNSDTYYFGKFRVREYGQSRVYIARKNPPFIVLTLSDTYIFINCETKEETLDLHNQLKKATGL